MEPGPATLHGFYSHGFPNLFHLGSQQNANSVNFVHILQEQATQIAAVIAAADGPVDALANVASIMDDFTPVHEVDDAMWDRVFRINVTA